MLIVPGRNLCRYLCRKNFHYVRFISLSTARSQSNEDSLPESSEALHDNLLENAAESISPLHSHVDMSSYGFSGWLPTDWTPYLCQMIYNNVQLPWWGTIASVACILRIALLPWSLKYRIALGHVALAAKECVPARYRMKAAKSKGDSYGAAKAAAEVFRIYSRHNVTFYTPFKFPVAKSIMLLMVLWGIKGMVSKSVMGLEVGGALWFPNLLLADPYGILPVLTGLGLFTNVRVSILTIL